MTAYSVDLRQRIVAAVERGGESQPRIARRLEVSLPYVEKVLKRYRDTGLVTPPPHGGGAQRTFDAAADARLKAAVDQTPDATLGELRAQVGIACGLTTVWEACRRLKLTREKSSPTPL